MEMLVVQNERDEVRFKFALYGSYFLSRNGIDSTFNEMASAYDKRSKIAHGRKAEVSKGDIAKIIEQCKCVIYHDIMHDGCAAIRSDILTALNIHSPMPA